MWGNRGDAKIALFPIANKATHFNLRSPVLNLNDPRFGASSPTESRAQISLDRQNQLCAAQ